MLQSVNCLILTRNCGIGKWKYNCSLTCTATDAFRLSMMSSEWHEVIDSFRHTRFNRDNLSAHHRFRSWSIVCVVRLFVVRGGHGRQTALWPSAFSVIGHANQITTLSRSKAPLPLVALGVCLSPHPLQPSHQQRDGSEHRFFNLTKKWLHFASVCSLSHSMPCNDFICTMGNYVLACSSLRMR